MLLSVGMPTLTGRMTPKTRVDRSAHHAQPAIGTSLHECPDSGREGRSTPFSGDETVVANQSRSGRSKRRFKRSLPDAGAERIAQRVYTAIDRLSLPNARRLVDTYGIEPVLAALLKLNLLRDRGSIRNAPGLLVTMVRAAWQARHNHLAPRFVAEPARKSRHISYVSPHDDPVWKSPVYQHWRGTFFGLHDELEELAF